MRIIIDVSASISNYNKPPSPVGSPQKDDQHPKQFVVGRVVISPGMMWPDFDNAVATVLTNHSRVSKNACVMDDSYDPQMTLLHCYCTGALHNLVSHSFEIIVLLSCWDSCVAASG